MPSNQASYAIDIAASFASGDQTIAQLDAIAAKLTGGGRDASFFSEAIDDVNAKLAASQVATTDANSALSAGRARYDELEKAALGLETRVEKLALKHRLLETAAQEAASAAAVALSSGDASYKRLASAAERAASKVARVAEEQQELAPAAATARSALDREVTTLRQLERASTEAATEQQRLASTGRALGQVQSHVARQLGAATSKTAALQAAMGDLGGPLGRVGQTVIAPIKGFRELAEKFSLVVAGTVALTAAAVLVSAAFAALGVAVIAVGLKLADNARKVALSREAFTAASPELRATVKAFDAITVATGQTGDQLLGLTKKLRDAQVAIEDMPSALRAAATAEAALGAGGADQFISDIKQAKGAVGGLASEVQRKFGGIVSRQILGLEAQSNRLRSNVGRLFSGLDIEPALEGLSVLVSLFDENTSAGKTLKFLFETLVQPLVDGLKTAAVAIEAFVLGFLIGATEIYIALKPVIAFVKELFGFDDTTAVDVFKAFAVAGKVLVFVIGGIVAAFGVLAVAVGSALATLFLPAAALVALTATVITRFGEVRDYLANLDLGAILSGALTGIVRAIVSSGGPILASIVGVIDAVKSALGGVNLFEIGAQIMAGLAAGITGAAGKVVSAIGGAVTAAIGKAKALLGIASPSKVFAEIGENTSTGLAVGVNDAAPVAEQAIADLVAPPSLAQLAAGPVSLPDFATSPKRVVESPADRVASQAGERPVTASATQATSSGGISLNNVQFTFNGVEGAESAELRFRETLIRVLEGDLTQSGGKAA